MEILAFSLFAWAKINILPTKNPALSISDECRTNLVRLQIEPLMQPSY